MLLYPAIDLLDGKVVRLRRGNYAEVTEYGADPVAVARAYRDAGAQWLHVVDLAGARSGQPTHHELIAELCAVQGLDVQVGGGVRDEETIRKLLAAGARRVVLGTAALRDWNWFEQVAHEPLLANKLALGLDTRDGRLAVEGWVEQLDATAPEVARKVSDWPLAAIITTDIAKDGTLEGPNVEAMAAVAHATAVPVIASGGVGSLNHLRALRSLPLGGVIVGRALYEGAFGLAEAVAVVEEQG